MREIVPGSVLSHIQYGYLKVPKKIKSQCPSCSKSGEFLLKANFYQVNKTGLFAEGSCSLCKKPSVFVIMLNDDSINNGDEPRVYIYDPLATNGPLDEIQGKKRIPQDLVRSYRSALNVSQSKDHSATAVMAKRVLESVLKNFNGDKMNGQTLAEQFEHLPKNVDLSKPIQVLSHLVHPDSQFYKMLELEREIDDETAGLIMELLEGLIEYLFVLPERIDSLHERIEKKY
ncbi:hypothetical protein [Rossellomorea aquimaris]|uniref:hypothetical protein n=1 Tax=Rossellomorea aquimaris TaxID=189382 RepID=UPI0007D051F9|nr:hypothetical protein [Rossellomorea aquimaris]